MEDDRVNVTVFGSYDCKCDECGGCTTLARTRTYDRVPLFKTADEARMAGFPEIAKAMEAGAVFAINDGTACQCDWSDDE